MELNFRKYLEIYKHEIPLINSIHKMDTIDQALKDIEIHDKALGKGVFNGVDSEYLSVDKQLKKRFIEILKSHKKGENVDRYEVEAVKIGLTRDKNNHIKYLDIEESPVTGSHHWHRTWISIYDKWIELLSQLMTKY